MEINKELFAKLAVMSKEDMISVIKKYRKQRESKDVPQGAVATEMKTCCSNISHLERGYGTITAKQVTKYITAINILTGEKEQ